MADEIQTTRSTLGQRDVPICLRGKINKRPKMRRLLMQLLVRARAPSWAATGRTMWRREINGR